MTRNVKYITTSVLAAAIIMGTVGAPFSSAAKVIKLNKKTIYLNVGESTVIKLQNGKKKGKVTWKTSKKSVVKIIKKSVVGNKAQASLKAEIGRAACRERVCKYV